MDTQEIAFYGKPAIFLLILSARWKKRGPDTQRWKCTSHFLHYVSMKLRNVPHHSQRFAKPFWCGQRLLWVCGKWVGSGNWELSGADFIWYYHACFAVISRNPYYQEAKQRRLLLNDSAARPPGPGFLLLPWALPSCNWVCLGLSLGFCHGECLFFCKVDRRDNSNTFGISKCLLFKNHTFLSRVNFWSKKKWIIIFWLCIYDQDTWTQHFL